MNSAKEGSKDFYAAIGWKISEEQTGIELTVNEEFSLDIYRRSFREKGMKDNSRTNYFSIDYLHFFLIDFFGLDVVELGEKDLWQLSYFKEFKNYGMNLLGDERFKKYCRNNVDIWRQERELI